MHQPNHLIHNHNRPFSYTIEVQPASYDGMLAIRVSAVAMGGGVVPIASYTLDRWMIDPALGLLEAELEEEAAKEAAAGTDTGTEI